MKVKWPSLVGTTKGLCRALIGTCHIFNRSRRESLITNQYRFRITVAIDKMQARGGVVCFSHTLSKEYLGFSSILSGTRLAFILQMIDFN